MFKIPDSSDCDVKRAELTRLKQEHGLTGRELGRIMGCNRIYIFEYLACSGQLISDTLLRFFS